MKPNSYVKCLNIFLAIMLILEMSPGAIIGPVVAGPIMDVEKAVIETVSFTRSEEQPAEVALPQTVSIVEVDLIGENFEQVSLPKEQGELNNIVSPLTTVITSADIVQGDSSEYAIQFPIVFKSPIPEPPDDGDVGIAQATTFIPNRKVSDGGAFAQDNVDIIVGSDDTFYAVWHDNRSGNLDVYFSKSTNGGATWSADVRVNEESSAHQLNACITVNDDNTLYVIWADSREADPGFDLYFARSTDGGITWSAGVRVNDVIGGLETHLTSTAFGRNRPASIVTYGNDTIYVVWIDSSEDEAPYFDKSTDGGLTWNTDINIRDTDNGYACCPDIAVDANGAIYIVWEDTRGSYHRIYFSCSNDGGTSWLSNNYVYAAQSQNEPSLVAWGDGNLCVAWEDYETDDILYSAHSTNGGSSWDSQIRVDSTDVYQQEVELAANDTGHVYAVWSDARGSGRNVFMSYSSNGCQSWSPKGMANNEDDADSDPWPSAAINSDNTKLVVGWTGDEVENYDAIYVSYSSTQGSTWISPTRVGPPEGQSRHSPDVAVAGAGSPTYAVWVGSDADGDRDIYVSSSNDNWATRPAPVQINDDSGDQDKPVLVLGSDGTLYVVWRDQRAGYWDNFLSRSDDGGLTWTANSPIDTNSSDQDAPALGVDGADDLCVAWVDNRTGDYDIFVKCSDDGGTTWTTSVNIIDEASAVVQGNPSIVRQGNQVYVAWEDQRDGNTHIYYAYSADGGVSWSSNFLVDDGTGPAAHPVLGVDSAGVVHVAWQDQRDGDLDIYYSRSADNGVTWEASRQIVTDAGAYTQQSPRLVIDGADRIHLAWGDDQNSSYGYDVNYTQSADGGDTWEEPVRVIDEYSNLRQDVPAIAVDSTGAVHIVWEDDRGGTASDIYYSYSLVPGEADPRLVSSLTFTPANPQTGETVTAAFTVHNYGTVPAVFNQLYVGTPPGVDGPSFRFAIDNGILLNPGEEYTYTHTRAFGRSGTYTLEAGYYDGTWHTLPVEGAVINTQQLSVKKNPSRTYGSPPFYCGQAGEPVNTATGNFYTQHTDLSVPGVGLDFHLRRTYNSLGADYHSPLGYGWTHSYNIGLSYHITDDLVTIWEGDGKTYLFQGDFTDNYTPPEGNFDSLTRNGDDSFTWTRADQTVYQFDGAGWLTAIVDQDGHQLTFGYDLEGNLIQIIDTNGTAYTLAYTGDYVSQITSTAGITASYEHDGAGNLTSFTDAEGATTHYTYDVDHRMLTITDPEGKTYVNNTYDAQGRVIEQRDAKNVPTYFSYDDEDNTRVFNDALGNPLTHTYDDNQHLLEERDALGHTITYTYNVDDLPLAIKDKNGNLTTFTYNESGDRTSKTDALGHTWIYTYDLRHNLTAEEDPLGNVSIYVYDSEDHLIETIDSLGNTRVYTYNAAGLVIAEQDENGHVSYTEYNDMGLPLTVTNALGEVTTYTYDERGNQLSMTDAEGQTAYYAYDDRNQLITITDPLGYETIFAYDDNGNLVQETNGLRFTKVYTYDLNENLINETDWAGNVYTYTHDANNRRIREEDSLGYTTILTYNEVGFLVARQDKRGFVWRYTYDANGNMLTETDPLGYVTEYAYDVLNRVVQVTNTCSCGGAKTVRTVYDELGRVVEEIDGRGNSTYYEFDQSGRLITETDALGYAWTYTYDAAGNPLSETDPLGHTTYYEYDALGQVITTTNRLGYLTVNDYNHVGNLTMSVDELGHITRYGYDAHDNVVTITNALGYTTTFTYDAAGRQLTETDPLGRVISSTYDANGQLLAEQDAQGHVTCYEYDVRGQLISVTDAAGEVTAYEYDEGGNLIQETDPLGRSTRYVYDALGREIKTIDPRGHVTISGYDESGNLITVTDALSNTFTYTYDENDNLLTETDPLGFVTAYGYDALNRQTVITDPLGGVTRFVYDPQGQVIEEINAADQHTQFAYDAEGQLITTTDSLGHDSYLRYDATGNLIEEIDRQGYSAKYGYNGLGMQVVITNALGGVQTMEYNAANELIAETDQLSRRTTYSYGLNGNLISTTNPLGYTAVYTYDVLDRQIAEEDENGHVTRFGYNAAHELISMTLPGGQTTLYGYDENGNPVTETDALGHTWYTHYDELNRVITETNPLGHSTTYAYDALSQQILKRDAEGYETHYVHDTLGRLHKVQDALAGETIYLYDPLGNLISQRDANGNVTRFAYNALNLQVRETNPLGNTWHYLYDKEGNLIAKLDAEGNLTNYEYDALGRLVRIVYPDSAVTYSYNAVGNRLTMSSTVGLTTYGYDDADRLVSVTHPGGRTVGYAYDAVDNRTVITYPEGTAVHYAYDANGWLSTVAYKGETTSFVHDDLGRKVAVNYPNGAGIRYDYDAAGYINQVENFNGALGAFATYSFTRDKLGYKRTTVETYTSLTETRTMNENFEYDALGRLVHSWDSEGKIYFYEFDAVGNRTRMTGVKMVDGLHTTFDLHYSYNAANQLVVIEDEKGKRVAYEYDDNGRRISRDSETDYTDYVYDYDDRLTAAAITLADGEYVNGQREGYNYDGMRRRVHKASLDGYTGEEQVARNYIYDGFGWDVLSEYDNGESARTAHYVYDDAGQHLAVYDATGAHFFYLDDLGSVVGYSDSLATVSDGTTRYDDYGEVLESADSSPADYGYTGHERDIYTELVFGKNRYYDSKVGVWLTLDSERGSVYDPLAHHRYSYVKNNPINHVDPLGLLPWNVKATVVNGKPYYIYQPKVTPTSKSQSKDSKYSPAWKVSAPRHIPIPIFTSLRSSWQLTKRGRQKLLNLHISERLIQKCKGNVFMSPVDNPFTPTEQPTPTVEPTTATPTYVPTNTSIPPTSTPGPTATKPKTRYPRATKTPTATKTPITHIDPVKECELNADSRYADCVMHCDFEKESALAGTAVGAAICVPMGPPAWLIAGVSALFLHRINIDYSKCVNRCTHVKNDEKEHCSRY